MAVRSLVVEFAAAFTVLFWNLAVGSLNVQIARQSNTLSQCARWFGLSSLLQQDLSPLATAVH